MRHLEGIYGEESKKEKEEKKKERNNENRKNERIVRKRRRDCEYVSQRNKDKIILKCMNKQSLA